MGEHTALPWEARPLKVDGGPNSNDGVIGIWHEQEPVIAAVQFGNSESDFAQGKANAKLIVTAVNAHDELVEAARAINTAIDRMRQGNYTVTSEFNDATYSLKAALKLATGDES